MTRARPSRINARLSPEVARKVAYLEARTNQSTTVVIRESIERYYAAVSDEAGTPSQLLARAGFIACAEGPLDLSGSYKDVLARELGKKT